MALAKPALHRQVDAPLPLALLAWQAMHDPAWARLNEPAGHAAIHWREPTCRPSSTSTSTWLAPCNCALIFMVRRPTYPCKQRHFQHLPSQRYRLCDEREQR